MDFLSKDKILPLLDQVIVSGGNALVQILMLRVFGLDDYGVYAFIMIFIMGFLSLNQAIIILPFQVLFSKGIYSHKSKTINTLQFQFLALFVIAIVFFGLFNYYFKWMTQSLMGPICMYGIGYLLNDFVRKKLFVLEKYKKVVLHDSIVLITHLLVFGLVIYYEFSMTYYLYIIGASIVLIESFFVGGFTFFKLSKSVYLEHWIFSKWLIASTITQWFSGNVLITTAGVVMGAWVLGVVRMGQTINGVLGVLFQLMEAYFPAKVSSVYQKSGLVGMSLFLQKLALKSILLTTGLATILLLIRKPLIKTVFGIDLVQYHFIMYWFSGLLVISVINIVLRFYIRTVNKNRIVFESYILLFLFSIASSNFLILNWGINGIGAGLVIGQLIICIWFYLRIVIKGDKVSSLFNKFYVSLKKTQ